MAQSTFVGAVAVSDTGMKNGHAAGLRPLVMSGTGGTWDMKFGVGLGDDQGQGLGPVVWRVIGPILVQVKPDKAWIGL